MDQIDNALTFFRLSAGSWRSQRTSHHLLHRRAEAGGSLIEVAMLSPDDPRLVAMANLHNQNPSEVVGGCHVRWGDRWHGINMVKPMRVKACLP